MKASVIVGHGKLGPVRVVKPVKIEPIFNPLDYININEEEIPDFSKSIFRDRYLNPNEKIKFINEFSVYYLNDGNFKNKVEGKYLIFNRKKFYGYSHDMFDFEIFNDPYPDIRKWTIKIGPLNVLNGFSSFF